jgi:hypothetical protein
MLPVLRSGPWPPGWTDFRQSKREAEGARGVAVIGSCPEPTLIGAEDRGLPLAADTDNDARLRDRLRVFLRCGSGYKQAADELNPHFNTVKYRVGRAVARRGSEVAADRLDVEVALLVCHWYGAGFYGRVPPRPPVIVSVTKMRRIFVSPAQADRPLRT